MNIGVFAALPYGRPAGRAFVFGIRSTIDMVGSAVDFDREGTIHFFMLGRAGNGKLDLRPHRERLETVDVET